MRRPIIRAAIAALVLSGAGVASAQSSLCQGSETVQACLDRLRGESALRISEVVESQKEAARKTETGLDQTTGLGSSVKDFLPVLQLAGLLGDVQRDDKTGVVTVALNVPFIGSTGGASTRSAAKDNALQLRATIDPRQELFDPLARQLPAANRDALTAALLGAKSNPENATVSASYNISSRHLGRNFNQHDDTLRALWGQALQSLQASQGALNASLVALATSVPMVSFTTTLWADVSPADQATIARGIVDVLDAELKLRTEADAVVKSSGLDVYGQLVTNQPQLQITGSRSFRDDLFGPDVTTGRISWEIGLDNSLNAALGPFNGSCDANPAACLARYSRYAANPLVRAAIRDGARLSLYAEVVSNEAYHFTAADPVVDLAIAGGTGWTAGADYGRLIGVDDTGTASGRVDASVTWEAPSDKAADHRFVASVVVTKKLGDVSIPFGLVYANKPRFLTNVDEGLSANVGLKLNLFSALK
jgi:hypothetical protein